MGFHPSARMVRLTPLCLFSVFAVLCLVYLAATATPVRQRGYSILHEQPTNISANAPAVQFGQKCAPFTSGALHDVSIVLRLSAAAPPSTLPAYLDRLGCKQDLLIFSARKETSGGHDVLDALAQLRPEYRWQNPDFDIYDALHADDVSDDAPTDSWKIDKYTMLPMMEWAWYLRPDSKWFVFVEPDTYVNYDNLYRFLAAFNPATAHYFGSPIKVRKAATYADGGSGFVLSRAALTKLMMRGRMFGMNHHFPGTHFFGEKAYEAVNGEALLGQVLKKADVPMRGYWPMFNADKPATLPFGPDMWCEAILTLHHLESPDFSSLEQWEAARAHPQHPLTYEELFSFIEPRLQSRTEDWANLSDDVTFKPSSSASQSIDACEQACAGDSKCLQYQHSGTACTLGYSMRLGTARLPSGELQWTSGWMLERIAAFKDIHSPCSGARFVHPSP